MEISYQITPSELKRLIRQLPLLQRPNSLLVAFFALLVLFLPGLLVLAAFGSYFLLSVFGAITVIATAVVMWQTVRKPLPRLPEVTLDVTAEQLKISTSHSAGWRVWGTIKRLNRLADHTLIYTEENTFFAVPDRAFASGQQALEFSDMARGFHRQATAAGPLQCEAGEVAPVETILGTGAMQVAYRNTAAQLQRVAIKGFPAEGNAGRPAKKSWLFRPLLLLLLCLVPFWLWIIAEEENPEVQIEVFALIGLVAVTILMFRLLFHFSRWQWRRATADMVMRTVRVRINEEGIHHEEPYSASRHHWEWIGQIKEDDELIGVYTTQQGLLYVIPKAAFPTELDAERFISLARHYLQLLAESQATTPFAPSGAAAETGNPYQSPQTG